MTRTKVERRKQQQAPKELGFPERVALFVAAIHRQKADALFEGFASGPQQRAAAFAQEMQQWDSARRQGRLAHEFGVSRDAGERLQQLVVMTGGALRAAIVASLPPAVRAQFPQYAGGAETFPVAVRALAARLVKEASR